MEMEIQEKLLLFSRKQEISFFAEGEKKKVSFTLHLFYKVVYLHFFRLVFTNKNLIERVSKLLFNIHRQKHSFIIITLFTIIIMMEENAPWGLSAVEVNLTILLTHIHHKKISEIIPMSIRLNTTIFSKLRANTT